MLQDRGIEARVPLRSMCHFTMQGHRNYFAGLAVGPAPPRTAGLCCRAGAEPAVAPPPASFGGAVTFAVASGNCSASARRVMELPQAIRQIQSIARTAANAATSRARHHPHRPRRAWRSDGGHD